MKVRQVLATSDQCQDIGAIHCLLSALKYELEMTSALRDLILSNDDCAMEKGKPMVQLEFRKPLSPFYEITIRPEIRNTKMTVQVYTTYFVGGKGRNSKQCQLVEGMDSIFEAQPETTLMDLASEAKQVAIAQHIELLTRAGSDAVTAQMLARQFWK
ncbi:MULTISPECIES: hypothetical protein [Herbaspirillum]|uniref:Uncharacterized protein n=3 Tax=root TaxID=1 RepID=A0AAJ2HAU6_9BURK|nr:MULTISPECIES: hypothetical protein [Herbaspirillum]MDR9837081.1 hypothetical protein [Herbaspirillum huttiense]